MHGEGQAIAEVSSFSEPRCTGKFRDGLAALVVRIEEGFCHGQDTARFQGVKNLFQRAGTSRNFALDRDEQRPVEPAMPYFAFPGSSLDEFNVGQIRG